MLYKILEWVRRSRQRAPFILSQENIPSHIAIIMDGNGRWAKKRGLPRVAGHREGMKTVKQITHAAHDLGVNILTLYAFSTENWKRPKQEVDYLMRLPQEFLLSELDELIEKNVRVRMIGEEHGLPDFTIRAIKEAAQKTASNTGLLLNFALNYGSRAEIVRTVQYFAEEVQSGRLSIEEIQDRLISSRLFTGGLPDPDLLIRTSGELRLSNFMLWQLAYTELWFTDVLWPDFSVSHFHEAIQEYQRRARRYGAV
jgi:undecaprenyl diphosphate synthase